MPSGPRPPLPLAVVGRSCVLPGALTPDAFRDAILSGRDLTGRAPAGSWGIDPGEAINGAGELQADRTWHDRGGYVRGFERVFDPEGFARPAGEILGLDPLFHWLLHAGREALRDAGGEPLKAADLVLATLAYPTPGYSRFASAAEYAAAGFDPQLLRPQPKASPLDVFSAGGLAAYTLEALGLRGATLALDAACASSLYALRVAADRLERGLASHAIVAAATRADDLFIHMGFAALSALSRSGRCRPFDQGGDGLLPAEGAVAMVIRRLDDALKDGDPIYGVIRSVGLSNDGRDGGFLKPSSAGQESAIRRAYERISLPPEAIGYLECHATGTPVGDRIELETASRVFRAAGGLPLGSLKAQCGHLAAAAGLGGLLKVIEALRAEQLPPSPEVDRPLDLANRHFRLLRQAEPWPRGREPRYGAVSAFGFGGNNAHVIVEEPPGKKVRGKAGRAVLPRGPLEVAVHDLEIRTGMHGDAAAFADHLSDEPGGRPQPLESVEIDTRGLKIPPNDLKSWLPRDLLALETARRIASRQDLPARTAVLVGASAAPDPARHGMRWRLRSQLDEGPGRERPAGWIASVRDSLAPPLAAARVTGTMPNMAANRIHSVLDLHGPGFTVFAEEISGLRALEIAALLLESGEVDAAIVAAADLGSHPVLLAAKEALGVAAGEPPGDGAAALLLRRASEEGPPPLATVAIEEPEQASACGPAPSAAPWTGHAHAAQGLLDLAAEIAACDRGLLLEEKGLQIRTRESSIAPPRRAESAITREGLSYRVRAGSATPAIPSRRGPLRRIEGCEPAEPAPKVALLFNGAAAAARSRGREFLLAFPDTLLATLTRFPVLKRAVPFLTKPGEALKPFEALQASLLLSQVHARFVLHELRIAPFGVIGLSSGETNSILALGAWDDLDALYGEMVESGMYGRHLSGDCAAAQTWLGGPETPDFRWTPWRVRAPYDRVAEHLKSHPLVHVTSVHTMEDLVVAGPREAVEACVQGLAKQGATPLGHEVVAHTQALAPFAEAWHRIHHRQTRPVEGVRYYSQGTEGPCEFERDAIANALLHQALNPLNLVRTVEAAYADGVRVFIECGPRDLMAGWVSEILGGREHLAVALDGKGGLDTLPGALERLGTAGVRLDAEAWNRRVRRTPPDASAAPLEIPARATPIDTRPPARSAPASKQPPRLPPALKPVPAPAPWRTDAPARGNGAPPAAEAANGAEPEVAAEAAAAARGDATAPPSPANPALARLLDFHGRVAAVHEQFMAHQRELANLIRTAAAGAAVAPAGQARPEAPAPPAAPRRAAAVSSPAPAVQPDRPAAPPADGIPPETARAAPHPDAVRNTFPGPFFDREQLLLLATKPLSLVLGEGFRDLDGRDRVVRMPAPPFLLADRVLGIQGEQKSMQSGARLWTETDVEPDAWYLDRGRMPFGIFIEAGQADLLLISWLGADHRHPGDRVYRLLGCEVAFQGPLPRAGDTIRYAISITGFARHGAILMFFFQYDALVDGEVRMRVRHGQAGFFTDEELANTGGVLWDAAEADSHPGAGHRPYGIEMEKTALDRRDLLHLAAGRPARAFGRALAGTEAHQRTPALQGGRMLLLDRVEAFDLAGGPWRRGYLRAVCQIPSHPWVYDGHFAGDPCMPGTLMVEAALQAMEVFLIGAGGTVDHDGWRFEPSNGEAFKLRCRGQVVPGAKELVLEVFVRGYTPGREPLLVADLLGTADGVKAFHAERMGLRLLPDHPLATRAERLAALDGGRPDSETPIGARRNLRAVAWGGPVEAFGDFYAPFAQSRDRWPRLPGPPYLCLHRIVECRATAGRAEPGATVVAAFDFEPGDWFFEESGNRTMPHGVLLEAALQPCGWLASFAGCARDAGGEVVFRNLDGTAAQLETISAGRGTLLSEAKLLSASRSGTTTIVSFDVACRLEGRTVYTARTVFGFFPRSDMAASKGLPAADLPPQRRQDARLQPIPGRGRDGAGERPGPMWSLLKEAAASEGDRPGETHLLGRFPVDPSQWWFQAHFFEDPVQPGSLGLEAMIQLVEAWAAAPGGPAHAAGFRRLRLDPQAPFTWRYRGQVLPGCKSVEVHARILEVSDPPLRIAADAWLSVDGLFIYHARGLVFAGAEPERVAPAAVTVRASDPWIDHHRPTFTVPALPLTGMAEILCQGALRRAPGMCVRGLAAFRAHRWLACEGEAALRVEGAPCGYGEVEMRLFSGDGDSEQLVASGTVLLADGRDPGPLAPEGLFDGADFERHDYASSYLFHGPAFQHLARWARREADGEVLGLLDATPRGIPKGLLHPSLLDAAIHLLPSEQPDLFRRGVPAGMLAYPLEIRRLELHGEFPDTGTIAARARFLRIEPGSPPRLATLIELFRDRECAAQMELVQVLLPKGPLGEAPRELRKPFLTASRPVPGAGLCKVAEGTTHLRPADVAASSWLPGTLASVYGLDRDPPPGDAGAVALKEHGARRLGVHPRWVQAEPLDGGGYRLSAPRSNLFESVDATLHRSAEGECTVRDAGPVVWHGESLIQPWEADRTGPPGFVEDVFRALAGAFLPRFIVENPEAHRSVASRGRIFLANHQTGVESLLFVIAARAHCGHPVEALAKKEHGESWIGRLNRAVHAAPGRTARDLLRLADRRSPAAMLAAMDTALARAADGASSLLVHGEGTRKLRAREPVATLSSTLVDLAVRRGVPIVPVRFAGGLPCEPLAERTEFPAGFGPQHVYLGDPLDPAGLASLPPGRRRRLVVDRMNALGPPLSEEEPLPPTAPLPVSSSASVGEVVLALLAALPSPGSETRRILASAARTGRLPPPWDCLH